VSRAAGPSANAQPAPLPRTWSPTGWP